MAPTVKWLPKPGKHDFQAAEDYLSLIMPVKRGRCYLLLPLLFYPS